MNRYIQSKTNVIRTQRERKEVTVSVEWIRI